MSEVDKNINLTRPKIALVLGGAVLKVLHT